MPLIGRLWEDAIKSAEGRKETIDSLYDLLRGMSVEGKAGVQQHKTVLHQVLVHAGISWIYTASRLKIQYGATADCQMFSFMSIKHSKGLPSKSIVFLEMLFEKWMKQLEKGIDVVE